MWSIPGEAARSSAILVAAEELMAKAGTGSLCMGDTLSLLESPVKRRLGARMFWAWKITVRAVAPVGMLVAMCLREDMSFTTEVTRIGPFSIGVTDKARRVRLLEMDDVYRVMVATGGPAVDGLVRVPAGPSPGTLAAMSHAAPGLLPEDTRRVYREMTGRGSWTQERDASLSSVAPGFRQHAAPGREHAGVRLVDSFLA